MTLSALTSTEEAQWQREGFFIRPQFCATDVTDAMVDDVIEISRAGAAESTLIQEGSLIFPEANLRKQAEAAGAPAEERVAKVFRLHRRPAFHGFIASKPVVQLLQSLLGGPVDCFLSQFIFKNPGAWGQPWHQDSLYFPFDRKPQVGLWLAASEATLENGCLHVLPGSHREPVHTHIPDQRPGANYGYFEIVDHDMSRAIPVTMKPGDLLVFHSHLMHRSTDNVSRGRRAAMVYHGALRGTRDLSPKPSAVIDWMELPDHAEGA
jgi:ectoine hydroxylase-related dioxygenase (phytanoyl-CoA dioxygenase family)